MREVLENGITVVTEKMPYLNSVSTGIWVRGGSAADPAEYPGMAHFCEHMAFKASARHSSAEISAAFDAMGGYVNAYTAKLSTCFYCTTLPRHQKKATELLAEMVLSPAYLPAETETERGVILEEIAMCEDSADDLVMQRLSQGVWAQSVLGHEILGDAASVSAISPDILRRYHDAHYTGENIIVAAAGNFDEAEFLSLCRSVFGKAERGSRTADGENGSYCRIFTASQKDNEQTHLVLGFPSLPMFDERRYDLSVLSALTGGTMSSRLFQSLREREGLVYNVQSYLSPYLRTGVFCVYTALSPENIRPALACVRRELDAICRSGFSAEEITRAKEQLASGMVLELEGASAHMKMLAKYEMYGNGERTAEEILEKIDAVTADSVAGLARELLDYERMSISVVGKKTEPEAFYRDIFA